MVMKQNGKILPAKMGPVPSTNRVNAGICISGFTTITPMARKPIVPTFMKLER